MKHFFLISIFVFLAAASKAQYSDAQLWTAVDISKEFSDKVEVGIEFGQRFRENITANERSLVTTSLEYTVFDELKIEGGYRYFLSNSLERVLEPSHRIHIDASWEYSIEALTLGVRERVQYIFDNFRSAGEIYSNNLKNRFKLEADYDIFGSNIDPFTSIEVFTPLNNPGYFYISDVRFQIGMGIMLSMRSDLDIAYVIDQQINEVNPLKAHIINLTFGYKL